MSIKNPPDTDTPAVEQEAARPEGQTSQAQAPQAPEAKEKEPELNLTVAQPCKNPEGRFVGLSKRQRDALQVSEGGTVELFEGGQSLGIFAVGKGSSELTKSPELFSVNGVDAGKTVTVKKAVETKERVMKLGLTHGVEDVPAHLQGDEAKKYADRTVRRMQIIGERFPGADTDEYMTIPTGVLNSMTGELAKVAAISKQKVRYGSTEMEIVMVPAGNDIGLTTKAAQKLNIPTAATELRFRVDSGVLVID